MIDINLIRDNPELVKENIRKKFQDKKLGLVDEIIALDGKKRALQQEGDSRRAQRNWLDKNFGWLLRVGKMEDAETAKFLPK